MMSVREFVQAIARDGCAVIDSPQAQSPKETLMHTRTLRGALAVAASVTLALSFGPQAMASPIVQPASPTTPSAAPKLPKDAKTVTGRWIVQVSGAATAEGGTSSAAKASQDQVLREAGSEGLKVGRTGSFTSVYNGMAVTATDADADQLRDVAGVVGGGPVRHVAAPDPATSMSTKGVTSALAMTGADIAYSELG